MLTQLRPAFCASLAVALAAGTLTGARAQPAGATRQGDVVAFCRAHPTLDYPNALYFGRADQPGATPKQLETLLDSEVIWRCQAGRVWVCMDSADGDWCSKKDPSLQPSDILRQKCHDEPDSDSFNFADEHYSAYDWRCKGRTPVVIRRYRLDRRGFFAASWRPVVVRRGVVVGPTVLPDGPR